MLPLTVPIDPPFTLAHVKLCYPLFQAANPKWREMLVVWHEAQLLEGADETIQQRRVQFDKCFDKVRKLVCDLA
jgi:hypothetical protein